MVEWLIAGAAAGAAGWFSSRFAWWRPPVPWQHPRVLMYHMVSPHRPGARFNKLRVPPERFARQIAWLQSRGFSFIFADQLFAPEPLPERPVCLTFDDGYADNLTAADPVLAAHDAVATLYLVTDRTVGWSSKKKAHHSDDELQNEPKLTDAQVRTLLDTGRWQLGGHTRRHACLPDLDAAEARDEIASARDDFAQRFGVVPATFAYPFGMFDDDHAQMAREVGFRGAVTTEPGIAARPYADPMRLPRIKISGRDTMLSFIMRIRGGRRGLLK